MPTPAPAPAPKAAPAPKRFTGAEDRKRDEVIGGMGKRISWTKVVAVMQEAGFPERTTKSARNRHLRLRAFGNPHARNRCRKCGVFQMGHVCGGREPKESEL